MPAIPKPAHRAILATAALLPFALACGGPSRPASAGGSDESASSARVRAANAPPDAPAKPKRDFRYPAPFMEPSCAEPQPEGAFDGGKEAVQEVKKQNWDRLQRCIADLPEDTVIEGDINVKFRLDPDGVPRCVEAAGGSAVDEDVVRCVLATYRTFAYPKPRGGSKYITDSLRFETSTDDE